MAHINVTQKCITLPNDLNNEFIQHINKNHSDKSVSRWVAKAIRNELKRERRIMALEFVDSLSEKEREDVLKHLQEKREYTF